MWQQYKMTFVLQIMKELNDALNNASFRRQNGIVLIHHIWKESHSFKKLKKLVGSENSFAKEIKSLKEIHESFVQEVRIFFIIVTFIMVFTVL